METQDDEFDALLRSAMAERPEAVTSVDFAARAMAMSGPAPVTAPVRSRISIWPVVFSVLAIVAVAVFGVMRVSEIASNWPTDNSFSESTSFDTATLMTLGAIGLVFSVVWLVCRAAFVRSESELTLALTV